MELSTDAEVYTYQLHRQRAIDLGRNERIGAITCTTGLMAILNALRSRIESYCRTYTELYNVLHNISRCFYLLLDLQSGLKTSPDRAALITAEQVVASSINAVVLLDSLETEERSFAASHSIWNEEAVEIHLAAILSLDARLSRQRVLWQMKLDILNCESEEQAGYVSMLLDDEIGRLLAGDMVLKLRVGAIDQQLNRIAVLTDAKSMISGTMDHINDEIYHEDIGQGLKPHGFVLPRPHSKPRASDLGFKTEVPDWLGLSDITMRQLTLVSIIALPVGVSNLTHGHWYLEYCWLDPQQGDATSGKKDAEQTGAIPIAEQRSPSSPESRRQSQRRLSQYRGDVWAAGPRSRDSGIKVIQYLRRRSKAAEGQ